MNNNFSLPVILCVGTVNVPGDSLGPKVGDLLVEKYDIKAYVYGRTSRPVNGINYNDYVEHIKRHHGNSIVIAVDACLGSKNDVGRIKYGIRGLRAGAALNKNLASFGDLCVLGVVAEKGEGNLRALMNADMDIVASLVTRTAEKVYRLSENLNKLHHFTFKSATKFGT